MEPAVLRLDSPLSIKIRRYVSEDTSVVAKLPLQPRSQRLKPLTPDNFVEEPWRDYEAIKRTFNSSSGEYKYQPIHEPNSIRLVELLPGDPSEIIRINLLTAALDTDIEYDALSYEWGLPFQTSSRVGDYRVSTELTVLLHILCDGKQMSILKNLHGLLLTLRHRSKRLLLWADAISINQEDKFEIPQQLMLMGKIYRQAKTVLCWIGEEKRNTHNAFRIISNVADVFHIKTKEPINKLRTTPLELFIDGDLVDEMQGNGWLAVVDVFTRPYFGRIWVVQEIVLSQKAVIICGANQISWRDFLNVSHFIATGGTITYRRVEDLTEKREKNLNEPDYVRHFKVEDIVDQTDEDVDQFARKWRRVIGLGELQDAQSSGSRSLTLCLEQLLGHEVTNPKDRVYGMLGMIIPTSSYAEKHPMIPSYEKTIQQVYQQATEWAIRDLESLRILNLCEAPGTNVTENLPTWVPDLSKGPAQCQSHDELRSPQLNSEPSLLSMFSPFFSTSFNGHVLSVQAHIVDEIVVARAPFTFGLKAIFMMQHFKEFAYRILDRRDPMYPTGCTKLDAFWHTLIANKILDTSEGSLEISEPAPDFGKHFMRYNAIEFITNWGLPLKLTGKERDLYELRLNKAPFPLEEMFPEDVYNNISILALMAKQPFVRWMYRCLGEGNEAQWRTQVNGRSWLCNGDYGRQFFFSEKGWMGIGHPCRVVDVGNGNVNVPEGTGVKAGDFIAVLAGSDKVWVLRRTQWTKVFTIVGQAYVHGLSEGIGFDAKNLPRMKTIRIR